jgi:hypothetical protein
MKLSSFNISEILESIKEDITIDKIDTFTTIYSKNKDYTISENIIKL